MNKVWEVLSVVLLSAVAWGQCSHYPKAYGPVVDGSGRPVPFPTARVCSEPATGLTCTPLVSGLFSDSACTQALPNPMTGDGEGNIDFYVSTAPARIHLQINGVGISQIDVANVSLVDNLSSSVPGALPLSSVTPGATGTGIYNFSGASVLETPINTAIPEGVCSGALAGFDILCGNSALHALESSLNGGSFVPIPQLAGDLGNTAASPQVVSTHLAAPLPGTQGGTGVNSTAVFPASGTVDTGTGTNNTISKFTNGPSGVQGNSGINDNGTTVSTSENLLLTGSTNNICNFNGVLVVGAGCFSSLAAAISQANTNGTSGQTINVSTGQNDGSISSCPTVSVNFLTIKFMGSYYVQTSCTVTVADGVVGFSWLSSPNPPNAFTATPCTGQNVIDYRGSAAAFSFSTSAGSNGVAKINVEGLGVCLTNAGSSAIGIDMWKIGGRSRFLNTFVGSALGSNSQIGWRLNILGSDSEGNTWDNVGAAGTNICFQNNNNTIDDIMHLDCVGPQTNGSIGFDNEGTGNSAVHIFGNSISGYGTSIKANNLVNSTITIETESNNIAGNTNPDVSLSSGSVNNGIVLTGSVTKTATFTPGTNNHVFGVNASGVETCLADCPLLGMVLISDTTLASAQSSITISSIPGNHKHLRVEVNGRSANATVSDTITIQFNSDTGSNYDGQLLFGANTTTTSTPSTASTSILSCSIPAANAARANESGTCTIEISNYAGTTFEKSASVIGGFADSTAANSQTTVRSWSWRNTAAITSIKLFTSNAANFVAGTRVSVYGVN